MSNRVPCWTCGDLVQTDPNQVAQAIADQLALEVGNIVPAAVRDARLAVCTQCPFFQNGTCTQCGCYVRFRASLKNKHCPLNHWFDDKEHLND